MQYLLMIYSDENAMPEMPDDEEARQARIQPWFDYTGAMREAGVYIGGNALVSTKEAKTVTAMSGTPLVTDGPFAETREQLGGYYLIECDTMDEAVDWASKCPIVPFGRVEVRALVQYD